MKKVFITGFLIATICQLSGQVCSVDFVYMIGTNNYTSFNDTLTTSSCSSWSGCCLSFDYGDSTSGNLNSSGWNPFGWNHFYKYPGVYNACITMAYTDGGGCTCIDSTCKPITIADTGSTCQADYCYTAIIDTNGLLRVDFINTSTSDDSITNVYWDFNDGFQSTNYHYLDYYFVIPVPDQLTYLYIQTASGCQSFIVDTIVVGTTCDSVTGINEQVIERIAFYLSVYPTIIESTAIIEVNEAEKSAIFYLHDLYGRNLRRIVLNQCKTALDPRALASGLYLYTVIVDGLNVKTGKLLIQ